MTRREWGSIGTRKGRDGYWARWSEDGRRRMRGPFTTVRGAADELGRQQRRLDRVPSPLAWKWFEDVYIPHRIRTTSDLTMDYTRRFLTRFATFVGPDTTLRAVTHDTAQRWLDGLALQPSTTRLARDTLRAAWTEAKRRELVEDNVWSGVRLRRVIDKDVPFLSAEDVERLCRHGGEAASAIRFLCETALRSAEFHGLDWRDVQAGQLVVRGKGGKTRQIPLSSGALIALEGLRSDRRAHPIRGQHAIMPWGRAWLSDRLTAAAQDAGLPHLTPHSLRHAWASRAVRAGVPLPTVADWLGHASAKLVLQRYGRWAPRNALELALQTLEGESPRRSATDLADGSAGP